MVKKFFSSENMYVNMYQIEIGKKLAIQKKMLDFSWQLKNQLG